MGDDKRCLMSKSTSPGFWAAAGKSRLSNNVLPAPLVSCAGSVACSSVALGALWTMYHTQV